MYTLSTHASINQATPMMSSCHMTRSMVTLKVRPLLSVCFLQALVTVLKHTWPRLPAHAQVVWNHLSEEYTAAEASCASAESDYAARDENDKRKSSRLHTGNGMQVVSSEEGTPRSMLSEECSGKEQIVRAIIEAAEILWWAGGEAFREHLQQSCRSQPEVLLQRLLSTGIVK